MFTQRAAIQNKYFMVFFLFISKMYLGQNGFISTPQQNTPLKRHTKF